MFAECAGGPCDQFGARCRMWEVVDMAELEDGELVFSPLMTQYDLDSLKSAAFCYVVFNQHPCCDNHSVASTVESPVAAPRWRAVLVKTLVAHPSFAVLVCQLSEPAGPRYHLLPTDQYYQSRPWSS